MSVRPPSRASLAPTKAKAKANWCTPAFHHSSGRALARLKLLILIHPPHRKAEWRCSSGDWRVAPFDAVEPIACRCSEANRRAMPPDECRSEGTPSPSEGPDAGASEGINHIGNRKVQAGTSSSINRWRTTSTSLSGWNLERKLSQPTFLTIESLKLPDKEVCSTTYKLRRRGSLRISVVRR